MPASPPPRRRLPPADRRAELLAAGEAVVRRLGPEARIDHVAAAAAAARATFYVYFPTWEAFLLALRDRALSAMAAAFLADLSEQASWRALVARLPDLVLGLTEGLEGLHAAVFHGRIAHVPVDPEFDLTARLARLLASGAAEGALTVEDPGAGAAIVHAMLREAADRIAAGGARGVVLETCRAMLARALQARELPLGPLAQAALAPPQGPPGN